MLRRVCRASRSNHSLRIRYQEGVSEFVPFSSLGSIQEAPLYTRDDRIAQRTAQHNSVCDQHAFRTERRVPASSWFQGRLSIQLHRLQPSAQCRVMVTCRRTAEPQCSGHSTVYLRGTFASPKQVNFNEEASADEGEVTANTDARKFENVHAGVRRRHHNSISCILSKSHRR